ncbi:521_t:CDS:1 [Ambispora leptoticha]|uniref:521_t:CDS:1 n=1 Tax=Ambispora leptoticha TaxID=144679 RepID=A0A9N8WN67_9GLOM|nr:521_t:CDS:1 [Ambispora leptoticha]
MQSSPSTGHINFISGTIDIFNQQPPQQMPQQFTPARHVNIMQPPPHQQQLPRQLSAVHIDFLTGTINIFNQQPPPQPTQQPLQQLSPARHVNIMQPPPHQQQLPRQLSAVHIDFLTGTTNIFNQQPQQLPPAGHANLTQEFITGTTDIFS